MLIVKSLPRSKHLSGFLEALSQVDSMGFMPGKGTDVNIRCPFLNLSLMYDNCGTRVVASLDAEKGI